MELLPVPPSFILSFLLLCSSALGEENSKKNVFATLIKPVLEAKCVQCHGAEKDKGKLRMNTKEDLLKGGREIGEDILIKGNIEGTSVCYCIDAKVWKDVQQLFDGFFNANPQCRDEDCC